MIIQGTQLWEGKEYNSAYLLLDDMRISTVGKGSLPLFLDPFEAAATSLSSYPSPLSPATPPSGSGELDPGGPKGGAEFTRRVLLLLVPNNDSSVADRST